MKTFIYLALCVLVVSATSPIDNLSSALEMLDMQDLLDHKGGFDLSASFTYLGGDKDDDNGVAEQVTTRGNYNLLTFEGGKGKVKTGSFEKTKNFTSQGVVKFSGSGTFSARSGGSEGKGYFNGGSSTDFVFETDAGFVYAVREHLFSGKFEEKKYEGTGHIEVNAWQDANNSVNAIDYTFKGSKNAEFYSGVSKALADTVVADSKEYKSVLSSVFHGVNTKEEWSVSGTYTLDVYNSDGDEVYNKDGKFAKNGTSDEALGTFSALKSFNLPNADMITK